MSNINLKPNQAALVFEVSPEGEVNVDAILPEETDNPGDLAAAICTTLGEKLTTDEDLQTEIMEAIAKNKP